MRAPLSWLREYAAFADDLDGRSLAEKMVRAGLEVETVETAGADVIGPLVIGRVKSFVDEQHTNGKTIRWCQVDVGAHNPAPEEGTSDSGFRGIVCGAANFAVDDLVVVALPGAVLRGAVLPGDGAIAARKTYGHISDGMICSSAELGLGAENDGIIVLPDIDDAGRPVLVGQDAAPVLLLRDDVLDIAVTPDRGYCWSMRGLAREAAQADWVAFTDPVDRPVPAETAAGYPVTRQSSDCPLFVALTVTGVDPTRPSPRWLRRRVQLAGMRPISLAVDITNYVMLETGQPLHSYDADRLRGGIVVRPAMAGEKLVTLDDVERDLDPADLVIADESGPIGLAGVMGGATTELSSGTRTIVIEAAHFDAMSVARSSRRHKLSSEASKRFERGVDPGASYAAAHRVAALLAELAGGTVSGAETVSGFVPEMPTTTMLAELAGQILGTVVETEIVRVKLELIGCRLGGRGDLLRITPPTWRPDLRDPYDYVEEVGRLVGLDRIKPVIPPAPVGRGLTRSQRTRRAIHSAVQVAGFVELLSFPFLSADELDRMGVPAGDSRRRLVRLANPLSETSPYLRTTLLLGLCAAAARNSSRGLTDLALYEAGLVFRAKEDAPAAPRPGVDRRPSPAELAAIKAALPEQPRHLAALLAGEWLPAGWQGKATAAGWQQAVVFVETAARAVGVQVQRTAAENAPWHPGRCAEISIKGTGRPVGHAGELHPQVCQAFGLPARASAAEIDLDALVDAAPPGGSVAPISPFPVAKEDVALIVDADVPVAVVEEALRAGGGELCESVRLFDVYVGPQIGEGRKSLAFALRFRAPDRTLTEADAAAARDVAVAAAAETTGARQRTE